MLGTGIPIIMAESPTYYRAYKPVLKALQAIQPEDMSFRDELVYVKQGQWVHFLLKLILGYHRYNLAARAVSCPIKAGLALTGTN